MSSLAFADPHRYAANRRYAGVAITLAVHLALILAWQMAGSLPRMPQQGSEAAMQWLLVPTPVPAPMVETAPRKPSAPPARQRAPAPPPARDEMSMVVAPPAVTPAPDSARPALPDAQSMLENARRSVGDIDRALRKENRPLIVAPPDSPEIRMRQGMEQARAMAPSRLWEAPKVEELVNNTGDGARRTRVITGNGTYCITERAPTTSIDMIEKHGKQRFTSCPQHEEPAKRQVWRTARD